MAATEPLLPAPAIGDFERCERRPSDYAPDDFKVTFYNVGQGNCVLVTCPQDGATRSSYLVDCGSSEGVNRHKKNLDLPEEHPGHTQLERLIAVNKPRVFADIAKSLEDRNLVIVISHLDTDHYNWILELVVDGVIRRDQIAHILVGFGRGWSKTVSKPGSMEFKLKGLLDHPRLKDKVIYQDDAHYGLHHPYTLPRCGKGSPKVLSSHAHTRYAKNKALRRESDSDGEAEAEVETKAGAGSGRSGEGAAGAGVGEAPSPRALMGEVRNDDSIVLRFNYGASAEGCSLILPGDAEKRTTDHIIHRHNVENTTVLLASHHGAMTKGANDASWIHKVRPKIGVFSAGWRSGYNHPSCFVAGAFTDPSAREHRMGSIWDLESFENPSTCFVRSKDVLPIGKLYVRRRALFNTMNMGDVTVVFRPGDDGAFGNHPYVCAHRQNQLGAVIDGTLCSWQRTKGEAPKKFTRTPARRVVKKHVLPRRRAKSIDWDGGRSGNRLGAQFSGLPTEEDVLGAD